jgi:hypothetical protein
MELLAELVEVAVEDELLVDEEDEEPEGRMCCFQSLSSRAC